MENQKQEALILTLDPKMLTVIQESLSIYDPKLLDMIVRKIDEEGKR